MIRAAEEEVRANDFEAVDAEGVMCGRDRLRKGWSMATEYFPVCTLRVHIRPLLLSAMSIVPAVLDRRVRPLATSTLGRSKITDGCVAGAGVGSKVDLPDRGVVRG